MSTDGVLKTKRVWLFGGVACVPVQMRRHLGESLHTPTQLRVWKVCVYLVELSAGSLGAVAADVLPAPHLPDVHATVLPRQAHHRDTQ